MKNTLSLIPDIRTVKIAVVAACFNVVPKTLVGSGILTDDFHINWSISELNAQVNPTTCLGDTDCWIQQVTAPTLVVTCWI